MGAVLILMFLAPTLVGQRVGGQDEADGVAAPHRTEQRSRRKPDLVQGRCQVGSASTLLPRRQGSAPRLSRAAREARDLVVVVAPKKLARPA